MQGGVWCNSTCCSSRGSIRFKAFPTNDDQDIYLKKMVWGRSITVKLLNESKAEKLLMAESVLPPDYFYCACYHTDASLLYQCVIEGKLLLGSAGTTLGQLWWETLWISGIRAQTNPLLDSVRQFTTRYNKLLASRTYLLARVVLFLLRRGRI